MTDEGTRVGFPDLVGADLRVRVVAHPAAAEAVEREVLDEVARLERVLSPLDPDSEFCRWRCGSGVDPHMSPDLATALAASERFWVFSQGAYHPGAEPLIRRWRQAELDGTPPTQAELKALASGLELPYTAVSGPVRRTGDCSRVDLGPVARGYVLDRALEAGWRIGLASSIELDAAGVRRQRGRDGVRVVLDLPGAPDAPGHALRLKDAALARSSRPADGFRVGECVHRAVLDPRTGWPIDDIAEVVALAPDCMTAGVLASIAGLGRPTAGFPGCAWLVVHDDGTATRSEDWPLIDGTVTLPA